MKDQTQPMQWNSEILLRQIAGAYQAARLSHQWRVEAEPVRNALEKISARLPAARYAPVGVLGIGGTSIVIRVADSLFPSVDNALKFPRPIPGTAAAMARMMAAELQNLAEIRDVGLVRMLYYRTIPDVQPYGDLPFYLMEAVDGLQSTQYFAANAVDENVFLSILVGLATTLRYLHEHPAGPFVHLDLKPQNIVITRGNRPVLLDLGTCKRLTGSADQTVVAVTTEFAHPRLVRMLSERNGQNSDRSELQMTLPRTAIEAGFDVWGFGRVVLDWIGVRFDSGALREGALVERITPYSRKFLFLLLARIFADDPPSWLVKRVGVDEELIRELAITKSVEVVEQLNRLTGEANPLQLVPELARALTGSIQAAPGVHVPNTGRLSKTISLDLFRRLNSVTQLGIVSQVFPSAKHTRREHSLGTYGNVCRIMWALYEDNNSPLFRQLINDSDLRTTLVCALFHDLGQFPLAHDLEDIAPKVFDHEELTEAMIRGIWRTGKAGSKAIRFGTKVEEILSLWNLSSKRVIEVLKAKPLSTTATMKDKLMRSIISGPLDADKLDYLFRDSRNTDVPYPNGIDVERLVRCLTVVVVDRNGQKIPCLGVYAKGKVAAEFVTLSRYAMFMQVYWHHAVRAQKAMLCRAVSALLSTQTQNQIEAMRSRFYHFVCGLPDTLFSPATQSSQLSLVDDENGNADVIPLYLGSSTDLFATDAAVLNWLRAELESHELPEAELLARVISRDLYKRLWTVPRVLHEWREWDTICEAWEKLTPRQRNVAALRFEEDIAAAMGIDGIAKDVTMFSANDALSLIKQLKHGKKPWLLIDLPSAKPGSEIGMNIVTESQARRMRKDDRVVGNIQQSFAWQHYAEDIGKNGGNIRIYCDRRLVDTIDASLTSEKALAILRSALEAQK
jgi:serine/threonine protein kinase